MIEEKNKETDFSKPQIKEPMVNYTPTNVDTPSENLKSQRITKDTTIEEAILINPLASEIFMDVGLGCSGCFMSEVETIEQGLLAHGFNEEGVEMVVEELNRDE